MRRAMQATVDGVGRAVTTESIDCAFAKGGTLVPARNQAQVHRAQAQLRGPAPSGSAEDDLRWLAPPRPAPCAAQRASSARRTPRTARPSS